MSNLKFVIQFKIKIIQSARSFQSLTLPKIFFTKCQVNYQFQEILPELENLSSPKTYDHFSINSLRTIIFISIKIKIVIFTFDFSSIQKIQDPKPYQWLTKSNYICFFRTFVSSETMPANIIHSIFFTKFRVCRLALRFNIYFLKLYLPNVISTNKLVRTYKF